MASAKVESFQPSYTCWIGNIIYDGDFEHLKTLFKSIASEFGEVKSLNIADSKNSNLKQCYINYSDRDVALKAVNHFNDLKFSEGNNLVAKLRESSFQAKASPCYRVTIINITTNYKVSDLATEFKKFADQYGKTTFFEIVFNDKHKKYFCNIDYINENDAREAVKMLDNRDYDGLKLKAFLKLPDNSKPLHYYQ